MEKTPRYTQRERNMVLGYAAQYKDVIENKRTDAESNRKKDEVWLQIAKEFNSRVYHQRSAKQLRQLYKNMKLLLKKDLCGEDKGNRSFMDLLNTLSQQESVAQYIAEQMSPDGAGGGGGVNFGSGLLGANGHQTDDYDDSKPPLYEGMDTEVILIKSETISDNEQTENGMDCLDDDDDDDDDCMSHKAPEVCLEEEEDEVLFATDLRQLQQQQQQQNGGTQNGNGGGGGGDSNGLANGLVGNPRAASSPVCSTKTSVSSTGSYLSATPKAELSIQNNVGNIRVTAFANINKALQNGTNNNNNNNSSSNNNNNGGSAATALPALSPSQQQNGGRSLQLTAEQVQQHFLLNGLGLSAVNPPAHSLQAAINAATSGVGSGSGGGSRRTPPTHLQLPRLQRGVAAGSAAAAPSAAAANGVQLLLNGHQSSRERERERDKSHNSSASFHGFNGNGSANNNNSGSAARSGSGGQHNEYMLTLAIEERKRKIELLNAQIEYWQTLTKKLDAQPGHYPNPSCLCHFPSSAVGGGVGSGAALASTAAPSALQTQASSS